MLCGLIVLSGQNQSLCVILKKGGLSLSKYFILVSAFVLNILINIIGISCYIYQSFSQLKLSLFATDFYLVRDVNTNSLGDLSKIL